jgi:hypothetical protein
MKKNKSNAKEIPITSIEDFFNQKVPTEIDKEVEIHDIAMHETKLLGKGLLIGLILAIPFWLVIIYLITN